MFTQKQFNHLNGYNHGQSDVSKVLTGQITGLKPDNNDDDYERGYWEGVKDAFTHQKNIDEKFSKYLNK